MAWRVSRRRPSLRHRYWRTILTAAFLAFLLRRGCCRACIRRELHGQYSGVRNSTLCVRPIDWFFGNRQVRRLQWRTPSTATRQTAADNMSLRCAAPPFGRASLRRASFLGAFSDRANFSSNGEPGTLNYHRFYSIVPDFCHCLATKCSAWPWMRVLSSL